MQMGETIRFAGEDEAGELDEEFEEAFIRECAEIVAMDKFEVDQSEERGQLSTSAISTSA